MMKWILLMLNLYLFIPVSFAEMEKPLVGWHWYNESANSPLSQKPNQDLMKAFSQLSPTQQLKVLQLATDRLKAKAILSGKVSDIAAFKQAQDFWLERATQFTVGWEQMLLMHPELNYSLQHPHENAVASMIQQNKHAQEERAIEQLAQTHGLLFFYRGQDQGDRLFAKLINHFATLHHFTIMPISVDGVLSPAFNNSQNDQGLQKARALEIHYFPAVLLVNPRRNQYLIVNYGFQSEDELSDRLLKIANGWKAGF